MNPNITWDIVHTRHCTMSKELKGISKIPNNIYYIKTQNLINLLTEKIVASMCLNGEMDLGKYFGTRALDFVLWCNNLII
jgi:hypothetical protein